MRRFAGTVVLVLAATALLRAGDEAHTIKLKEYADKGQVVKVVEHENNVTKIKITDAEGKVLRDGDQVRSKDLVYTETVTAAGDKGPTRIERKYTTATITFGNKKVTMPQQGRTIVYEYDGKVTATAVGEPALAKEVLQGLAREANRSFTTGRQALLPKKAVKVGESWTIPGKDVAAGFGVPLDQGDKIKAKGKFLKAYKKGGKQWGQLFLSIQAPVPTPDRKTIRIDSDVVVDFPIDGSSTDAIAKATMKVPTTTTVMGEGDKKITIVSSSVITTTTQRTEMK